MTQPNRATLVRPSGFPSADFFLASHQHRVPENDQGVPMFLEFKDEHYRKLADRINERVAKDFSYAKADIIRPEQLKYAITEARQFFLEQGGKQDRNSQVRDCKVIVDPPEARNFFRIETGIGGPYAAGGFKLVAVPQHERLAERKRDMMEDGQRPWMRVDVGEGLRLHHENRRSICNPTSTWSKADWDMERSRLFDEAKATAKAANDEKPAVRAFPPPPAFMVRDQQKPQAAIQR
jgi:hypothetical protein